MAKGYVFPLGFDDPVEARLPTLILGNWCFDNSGGVSKDSVLFEYKESLFKRGECLNDNGIPLFVNANGYEAVGVGCKALYTALNSRNVYRSQYWCHYADSTSGTETRWVAVFDGKLIFAVTNRAFMSDDEARRLAGGDDGGSKTDAAPNEKPAEE